MHTLLFSHNMVYKCFSYYYAIIHYKNNIKRGSIIDMCRESSLTDYAIISHVLLTWAVAVAATWHEVSAMLDAACLKRY